MPRRPRNGFVLLDGQALHRLVAAGIDGADRDRPAARPSRAPWRRRDTASPRRAASSPVKRNSVRIRPTPSQVATSMHVDLLRSRDVDHDVDARAVGGRAPAVRGGAPRSPAALASVGAALARELRARAWPGLEHDGAPLAVDHRLGMAVEQRCAEADDHRHAARSGRASRRGSRRCRRRARCRRRRTSPPPGSASASRLRRSGSRRAGAPRIRRAGEVAQHAVAQVVRSAARARK